MGGTPTCGVLESPLPVPLPTSGKGSRAAGAGKNGALASAMPLADRLVSGVPPTPSRGGAGGLPDLPRDGRGRGVVSETRDFECPWGCGAWGIYGAGRGRGQLGNEDLWRAADNIYGGHQ